MGGSGRARAGDDVAAELVAELRDAVARRIPGDVAVRDRDTGFAVGYPDPLVMSRDADDLPTCLWAYVACDPATLTFRITDVLTGPDRDGFDLGRRSVVFRGRMTGDRRVREYGTLPDGTRGVVREQVHSPRVLHAAIREPAAELGWHERQPVSAVVGKVVGIASGVAVVLSALVIAVLAVTGRLG